MKHMIEVQEDEAKMLVMGVVCLTASMLFYQAKVLNKNDDEERAALDRLVWSVERGLVDDDLVDMFRQAERMTALRNRLYAVIPDWSPGGGNAPTTK